MNKPLLSAALCAIGSACLATGAHAQQTVTFLCLAPTGHVCQYAVQTGGQEITFALPSGERKEVPGITPHADKYCVCDPGPVTPDCSGSTLTLASIPRMTLASARSQARRGRRNSGEPSRIRRDGGFCFWLRPLACLNTQADVSSRFGNLEQKLPVLLAGRCMALPLGMLRPPHPTAKSRAV
jgi:hypothetical protein